MATTGGISRRIPQRNTARERSRHYKHYAAVAADIDLYTEGPLTSVQLPCAEIRVWAAGDLVVERVDKTIVTFSGLPVGAVLPIEAAKIIDVGTTAIPFSVFW
jgi:hypothetical protein